MAWIDYGTEVPRRSGMIIGLAGFARTGKDTVGKMLIENHNFTRISFASPVYKGLYDFNPVVATKIFYHRTELGNSPEAIKIRLQEIVDSIGWERAKVEYEEIRTLLQRYGTEAGRNIHGQDCWVKLACEKIKAEPNVNFVVTDVRFPNEVQALKALGAVLVQVTRKGVTSVNNHISDKGLPDEMFNHFIRNNGTLEDLKLRVNELIQEKGIYRYTAAATYEV